MFDSLRFRLRGLLDRQTVEAELDDELRAHLAAQIDKHVRSGASLEEAKRRAQLEFGGLDTAKEACREARAIGFVEAFVQDARYGLRTLRKNPGFTAVAVLTLALGIGSSSTVFSVVETILLKPLPYPEPSRIVMAWRTPPIGPWFGSAKTAWIERDFPPFLRSTKTFQSLGAFKSDAFNLIGGGEPALVDGVRVSAGFFPALGVKPALGRAFTAAEDSPGHGQEVVLSHTLWRERFGGDSGILGRQVNLDGSAYTVIGVMPAGFEFPRGEEMPVSFDFPRVAQLWVPLGLPPAPQFRPGWEDLAVIGRLRPDVSMAQAQSELDLFARHLEADSPTQKGWFNCQVTSLAEQVSGDARRPLLLMLAAVGVVLLVACANIASLLLTRAVGRRREFTLRAALGAGPGRLMRHLLTESLLLAAAGGVAGLLLAVGGIHLVKTLGPTTIPRLREVGLDLPVVVFVVATSLLTAILFGLAPAVGTRWTSLIEDLKEGVQRAGGGSRPGLRNAIVVGEVALALVLVAAASLLAQTFVHVLGADPGYRAAHVLTFQMSLPSRKYADPKRIAAVYDEALAKLQAVPGVQAAGIVTAVPMAGATDGSALRFSDLPSPAGTPRSIAAYTIASPGYFAAVGATLLRGRVFLETDTAEALPVAVINATMARKFWPGEDPIGKKVGPARVTFPLLTVVGIVGDIRQVSLREDPTPELYVMYKQKPWPSMLTLQVALRTRSEPSSVVAGVRDAIRSVDRELPVARVATLSTLADETLAPTRFSVVFLGAFGGLALLLAAIGMYGVISYSVRQRRQEIGIRMALGASRQQVFGMVIGEGARLAGLGIALGMLAALVATRAMASFLYGVQASDPATFVAVSVVLASVALLACYLPARRAMRVDPVRAMRLA
jgi:predicted permease